MLKYKLNKNIFEIWLYAICVFLLTPPFFVWSLTIIGVSCLAIITVLGIKHLNTKRSFETGIGLMLFLLSFYFYLSGGINDVTIYGLMAEIMVLTLFLTKGNYISRVYKAYVWIFGVTLIPSLIVYVFVILLGIHLPHSIVEPLNNLKSHNYNQYFFLVTPNYDFNVLSKYRFCGYYDEPGVVGTTSAVILMLSGYNLKSKINFPVLIAGLFSLSLFFYLASFLYFLIFLKPKFKIVLLILGMSLYYFTYKNQVLSKLIYDRAKIENGTLTGDNRNSQEFESWYKEFSNSPDYYFGLGKGANLKLDLGGASYKDSIVNYGLIPVVIFLGMFLLIAYNRFGRKKSFFIFTLVLVITFYQRPFINQFYGIFIILGALFYMHSINTQNSQIGKRLSTSHRKFLRSI